ncbi:DUF2630 family protein [uncultured Nocardioides sp.]|uniref:DUF2630 family protein n=1 Tax=uncultured Nocardioides sp. TaxID=198441 RepID=UPI0025CDA8A0|nr:DUF2630 family protein [uncultured Nocardioides sp.]
MSAADPEQALLKQVADLVDHEHVLRQRLADPDHPRRIESRAALHHLEEELDQCWDLLRQRRALRTAHLDPEGAHVRPVEQVENYLPRPGGAR